MPSAFIANVAVDLPQRIKSDVVYSSEDSERINQILNAEYVKRLIAQLRWRLQRGQISKEELPIIAWRMGEAFMFDPSTEHFANDDDDPIMAEAIEIAREMIIKELSAEGITAIPKLDEHAKALAQGSEEIRNRARARVEARWRIAQETLVT